ncbi:hypothetical protein TWF696_004691 [Orbilia brochopaga]
MIHFERKPTTRMTSRKAQKYEPRRESQSSDAQDSLTTSSDSTSERRRSVATPVIDAAAARKTAAEALSSAILQGIFDTDEILTASASKSSLKRRASDVEDSSEARPTKLQILDQTLVSSPTNIAPVAPMFGRRNTTNTSTASSSSTAISPTTVPSTAAPSTSRAASSATAAVFPGFDIDPLLADPGFDARLEEETAEETMRMFTHSDQQLFSPPLSEGSSETREKEGSSRSSHEDYLRDTAAEAWKLQLAEEAKATA